MSRMVEATAPSACQSKILIMPDQRLIAVVTAFMLLAGTQGAQAAFTLAQLQEVERLILSKDCAALLGYLLKNPELMDGDDPLALEFRNFASGVESGLIECLSVQTDSAGLSQDRATSLEPAY